MSEWDDQVASHRGATFFHTQAWARVIWETYGHRPAYLVTARGPAGAVVPMMELNSPVTGRRGVCLPYTDECGPLMGEGTEREAILRRLHEHARARRWRYFEIRESGGLFEDAPASVSFHGHYTDLSVGEEALFQQVEGAVRRAIRKAQAGAVQAEISQAPGAMEEYYRLHCRTRRKHGLPPQPWSFFANIHRYVVAAGAGFVSLARVNGKPVAGSVFFLHRRRALYKFGASDERFQQLRGSNLQMWEAMRWLIRHGYEELDFGRTSLANAGLRRFKLGWAAKEKVISYAKYDMRRSMFVTDMDRGIGWYNRWFSMLPVPLLRWVGSWVYRHMA